jgi:tyrosinase
MSVFIRKNAWNNNGTFDNPDLLWYAKAVQVMQSRPIKDATSWWFYAAIHGQYLVNNNNGRPPVGYPNWKHIPYIPSSADLTSLPQQQEITTFWDQCQHGTWFFAPWHRGYLVALESLLRDIIVNQLNGPADWALPYWNYLNQSTTNKEYTIPQAFTVATLPDGTSNPLYVPERYGPDGNGKVYVVVGPGTPSSPQANDECQLDTIYSEAQPSAPGSGNIYGYFYGGQETGFSHSNGGFGDLESNPHNFVHVMVGGFNGDTWTDPNASEKKEGLMSDPPTAALDPIFYLHHANIDRMWDAWNVTGQNANPNDPNWLAGPTANGNSRFAMPLDAAGTPWYYTPEDVDTTNNLNFAGVTYSYTYDDLSLTSYEPATPRKFEQLQTRLLKLGAPAAEKTTPMVPKRKHELIGGNAGVLALKSGETQATVRLDTPSWTKVSESLRSASLAKLPDEVFLQLENVRGTNNSNFLSVFVNGKFINSVALFGIRMASLQGGAHGGAGLTFTFNITNVVDDLHLNGDIDLNALNVVIKTKNDLPADNDITIDKISVYRVAQ